MTATVTYISYEAMRAHMDAERKREAIQRRNRIIAESAASREAAARRAVEIQPRRLTPEEIYATRSLRVLNRTFSAAAFAVAVYAGIVMGWALTKAIPQAMHDAAIYGETE